MKQMHIVASKLDPYNKTILLGDFNCDFKNHATIKDQIETEFSVDHIETQPTFQNKSGSASSTIDHVFTDTEQHSTIIECPYSDHNILCLYI